MVAQAARLCCVKRLGTLEAVVMERLWTADGPVSVRSVLEQLTEEREIAYTTVMTVLDNLHSKGFASRAKDGRAYRYCAAVSREEHTAGMLDDVLAGSPDRSAALMHFVERLSDEDLDGLRSALDAMEDEA